MSVPRLPEDVVSLIGSHSDLKTRSKMSGLSRKLNKNLVIIDQKEIREKERLKRIYYIEKENRFVKFLMDNPKLLQRNYLPKKVEVQISRIIFLNDNVYFSNLKELTEMGYVIDMKAFTMNPNVSYEDIMSHPELDWDMDAIYENPNCTTEQLGLPTNQKGWNRLTKNINLSLEFVEANLDKSWRFMKLLANPIITPRFILKHFNLVKDLEYSYHLKNPNLTLDFVIDHPELEIDTVEFIVDNGNVKYQEFLSHPELNIPLSEIFHNIKDVSKTLIDIHNPLRSAVQTKYKNITIDDLKGYLMYKTRRNKKERKRMLGVERNEMNPMSEFEEAEKNSFNERMGEFGDTFWPIVPEWIWATQNETFTIPMIVDHPEFPWIYEALDFKRLHGPY